MIQSNRSLLWGAVVISVLIVTSILMSGAYLQQSLVLDTLAEVEVVDGKYIMSDEIQITDSGATDMESYGNDCSENMICWRSEGEVDTYLLYYDIDKGTVNYAVEEPDIYQYPRCDDNQIIYNHIEIVGLSWEIRSVIHDTQDGTNTTIPSPMTNVTFNAIWQDTCALNTYYDPVQNYSLTAYDLAGDTYDVLLEGDGTLGSYPTYEYADVHEEHVVSVRFPSDNTANRNIAFYNLTSDFTGDTEYTHMGGTSIQYMHPKVWDGRCVVPYYYYESGLPPTTDYAIQYFDLNGWETGIEGEHNETFIRDTDDHTEFYSVDISQDLMVFDAWDEAESEWHIYAYDVEEEIEFNITSHSPIGIDDAFEPTVWIGDDGYGHVAYAKYNWETDYYDVYMRFINDTTLITEDVEEAQVADFSYQTIYDHSLIYVALIMTSVAICGVIIDRILFRRVE